MKLLTADFLNSFAARLKEATLDAGLTMGAVAQKCGVARSSASAWYNGQNAPAHVKLIAISEFLNVTPEWLLFGIGEKNGRNDSLPVQVFNSEALDPVGSELFEAGQIVRKIDLDKDWLLSKFGFTGETPLYVLSAQGNSMRPTIEEGDILLMEPFNGRIQNESVYVAVTNGQLTVKRFLLAPDGSILMSSDNPSFHSFTVQLDKNVTVVGRVIFRWHGERI